MEEQGDASNNTQQQLVADWYLCSGHRFLWKILIAAGLVPVFVVLMLRGVLIEPIRNRDIGREQFKELYDKPVAPESENAVSDYLNAFKSITNEKLNFDPVSNQLVLDDIDAQKYFDANATALNHLYRATEKKTCEINSTSGDQFLKTPFFGHEALRNYTHLLLVHARRMARSGDHRLAAHDFRCVQQMSLHDIHANWRRCSWIEYEAISVLESILIHDPPAKLEELLAYRESITFDDNYIESFGKNFEKLSHLSMIEFDNSFSEFELSWQNLCSIREHNPAEYFEIRREQLLVFKRIQASINGGPMEFKQCLSERYRCHSCELESELTAYQILMRLQYCLFFNFERRNCADTGLAIMSFRCKYKHDPNTLAELVPEFLNEIPRAYFVPHSVNYIKQNGAWIIYTKSPHEDHDGRPIGDYFKRYGVEYNGPETLGGAHFFVPPMK